MDYEEQPLRICKKGVYGTETYAVWIDHGMIVLESGTVGGRLHRVLHPLAEKRRIDRFFANLLRQGFVIQERSEDAGGHRAKAGGTSGAGLARPGEWVAHGRSPLRKT